MAEPLRCGTLDVPEDRAHPEGRWLHLPVIVLPALGRTDPGIPMFELLGGPGMAATTAAPLFASELAPLRRLGDIVLVDQRGTGVGPSSLTCPELDEAPPSAMPSLDAVRGCREALAGRADLRFYGSMDVVQDLEDARRALGYARINLEAVSYGTRVAQLYLRRYGEHVGAVVLFGAVAPDVHVPAGFAEHAQQVLDAIVDDCARDLGCARAYPDLRGQLAALAKALPAGIDRTAFTEWVRHQVYSVRGGRKLPQLVARAAAGDFTAFTRAHAPPLAFRQAVRLAVSCSEDQPGLDLANELSLARATWFGSGRVERQAAACEGWPRALLPGDFRDPVSSDVPLLAIAGRRDPVTPPAYARRATERMTRAQVVEVADLGHDPSGLVGLDCLLDLEIAFLGDPSRQLDTSCLANTAAPAFDLP